MGDRSAVVNLFYRRLRQGRHVHLKWSGEGVMFGGNDDFLKIASCGGYQPYFYVPRGVACYWGMLRWEVTAQEGQTVFSVRRFHLSQNLYNCGVSVEGR